MDEMREENIRIVKPLPPAFKLWLWQTPVPLPVTHTLAVLRKNERGANSTLRLKIKAAAGGDAIPPSLGGVGHPVNYGRSCKPSEGDKHPRAVKRCPPAFPPFSALLTK